LLIQAMRDIVKRPTQVVRVSLLCFGVLVCGCAEQPSEIELARSALTTELDGYAERHILRLSQKAQEDAAQKQRCDDLFKGLHIGVAETAISAQDPDKKCAAIHTAVTARSKRSLWEWSDGSGRSATFENGKLALIQD
jgi:hypothetical protein